MIEKPIIHIRRSCVAFLVMSTILNTLCGQSHDYLFHPSFFDDYLAMQILPDNKVRVFALADQNNAWVLPRIVFSDFSLDSLDQDQVPRTISVDDDYINYFVQNPLMLRCADGSTIIASNFFDCDYGGADAIYKLNPAGIVDWHLSFWNEGLVRNVNQLAFVDSNTIFVGDFNAFMHFDLQGNELQLSPPEIVFEHSLQTSYGYVGSIGDSLVIVDQHFQFLQLYLLEGKIEAIEDVQFNEFRIATSAGYYVLKPDLQVYSLPISKLAYFPIWSSPSAYWGYAASEHVVIRWDTFFNPVDTLELGTGVAPTAGISISDQVLMVGTYQNEISRGVIVFQDDDEHVDFSLDQDIGITEISISDSVLVEYFNSNVPFGGWSYHVPALTVEVQNFGPDTVRQFYMQGHDLLDCFWWCLYPHPFWPIDTLVLPPGAKGEVQLREFVTRCGNTLNAEICISTMAPEGRADGNYLNDKYCQSFDFVLETEVPLNASPIVAYPSPATEKIYFNADQANLENLTCTIVDATGHIVDKLTDIDQEHAISDYAPGIYLLMFTNPEGIVGYQRIVKVNQ